MGEKVGKRGKRERTADEELAALRESLRAAIAELRLAEGGADVARLGGVVARLCDSIGRAKLRGAKLGSGGEEGEKLYAMFERALREMGSGES